MTVDQKFSKFPFAKLNLHNISKPAMKEKVRSFKKEHCPLSLFPTISSPSSNVPDPYIALCFTQARGCCYPGKLTVNLPSATVSFYDDQKIRPEFQKQVSFCTFINYTIF